MSEEIRESNIDPIGYAWRVFHLGDKATKDQLRRALVVALKKQEDSQARLNQIEPVALALETMIANASPTCSCAR